MRPRFAVVSGDPPAVLADVKMSVIETVGRHVRREIPAAATEIGAVDTASAETRDDRQDAARDDVLLVTMNHVGISQLVEQSHRERIRALTANEPGIADDADSQAAGLLLPVPRAEGNQARGITSAMCRASSST